MHRVQYNLQTYEKYFVPGMPTGVLMYTPQWDTFIFVYLSSRIELIIGQLDFIKRYQMIASIKLFNGEWSVLVNEISMWWGRIRFSGDQPRRPVIGISITSVITRNYVQKDSKEALRPNQVVKTSKTTSDGRKHSSENVIVFV